MAESNCNDQSLVRSRTLTNPAAEYVENHLDRDVALGVNSPMVSGMEFVPTLDKFLPRDKISNIDYYQESRKQMHDFSKTMNAFVKLMKERQLDQKLGIPLKTPETYLARDVLSIALKLQSNKENCKDLNPCLRTITKCFRSAGQHSSTLQAFLKLAPSESYGSVICGGISMILAGMGRVASLRKEMYSALQVIPETLEMISALKEPAFISANVFRSCDSVLVLIFIVMERIIDELSGKFAKRAMLASLTGAKYAMDVTEAVTDLKSNMSILKDHLLICNTQKLGSIRDEQTRRDEIDRHRHNELIESNNAVIESNNAIHERLGAIQKSIEHRDEQKTLTNYYQSFYTFIASDHVPLKEGVVLKEDTVPSQTRVLSSPKKSAVPSIRESSLSRSESNEEHVTRWLQDLQLDPEAIRNQDIEESLRGQLKRAEEAKVQWILTSESILNWLDTKDHRCRFLALQGEPTANSHGEAAGFTAAFLAQTLLSNKECLVLYYSCGLRELAGVKTCRDGGLEAMLNGLAAAAGPQSLLNSLNAQLMGFLQRADDLDLSFLKDKRYRQTAQRGLSRGWDLFRNLLLELGKQRPRPVYIIIDSNFHLKGDKSERLIEKLLGLAIDTYPRTVKILMTDLLSLEPLRDRDACQTLLVPNQDNASYHGPNQRLLDDVSHKVAAKNRNAPFHKGEGSEESEDEEKESEDESEDQSEYESGEDSGRETGDESNEVSEEESKEASGEESEDSDNGDSDAKDLEDED